MATGCSWPISEDRWPNGRRAILKGYASSERLTRFPSLKGRPAPPLIKQKLGEGPEL